MNVSMESQNACKTQAFHGKQLHFETALLVNTKAFPTLFYQMPADSYFEIPRVFWGHGQLRGLHFTLESNLDLCRRILMA